MGRNGRAHRDNYEPTKKQGLTLPYINETPYLPKGNKVYATRRRRDNPPKDKNGVEIWHASTPDPYNPDYRWFWIFLAILVVAMLIYVGA